MIHTERSTDCEGKSHETSTKESFREEVGIDPVDLVTDEETRESLTRSEFCQLTIR